MMGLGELLAALAAGLTLYCRSCDATLCLSGSLRIGQAAKRAKGWRSGPEGYCCPACAKSKSEIRRGGRKRKA